MKCASRVYHIFIDKTFSLPEFSKSFCLLWRNALQKLELNSSDRLQLRVQDMKHDLGRKTFRYIKFQTLF